MAFLDGLSEAFRRLDCGILGSSAYILGGLRRLTGPGQGGLEAGINGLRRLRGCDPANDIVPEPPPFTGGQCDGLLYNVTFRANSILTNGQTGNQFTDTRAATGPIFGLRGGGTPEFQDIVVENGRGGESILSGNCAQGCFRNIELISVAPFFGSDVDNCGDPPPPDRPPINIDIDVPITYTDEGDNIVNIDLPVTFGPFNVDVRGDVSFPFEFNFGGIDFTGDVVFAPDFKLNVNAPRLPTGPINVPQTPTEPQIPVPLEPRGNKIQGVIVVANVVNDDKISSYEGGPIPDIFVPRLGSVKFAYSFGVSTVWSNDIDVKGTTVFIPCPFSQGADAVQGSPQEGVTFQLSAVTGPPLATVADLT